MKRIIFVFIGLMTAVYGFSQVNLQPAATVNLIRTEAVTIGQLRTEIERAEQITRRPLTSSERRQILDRMINERLFLQAAERDRISVTENEFNEHIQQLRNVLAQQIGRQPTESEFAQAVMNDMRIDMPTFRDQLRKQLTTQKYIVEKKRDLITSVRRPTEEEIENEYLLNRTTFVRPETIRVSMILVPFGPDAASRTSARSLADSLVREINNDPSRFDEVAARSVLPTSAYQAGDRGYIPRNQDARSAYGQDFMDVAFNLRQGQVSRLIEGAQGFQIIKVTENYAQSNLGYNDFLQPGTRVTVRQYIEQTMASQRTQAILIRAQQELINELRTPRAFQIFENTISQAGLN